MKAADLPALRAYRRSYNFLIVATARAGTHMLASMLDSHPDIECDGEIFQARDWLHKETPDESKKRGAILMWRNLHHFFDIAAEKYLVLLRDPVDTAISTLVDQQLKQNPATYRSHRFKHEPPIIAPGKCLPLTQDVIDTANVITQRHKEILGRVIVARVNWMPVYYESLRPRLEVGFYDNLLCEFLGVKRASLYPATSRGRSRT